MVGPDRDQGRGWWRLEQSVVEKCGDVGVLNGQPPRPVDAAERQQSRSALSSCRWCRSPAIPAAVQALSGRRAPLSRTGCRRGRPLRSSARPRSTPAVPLRRRARCKRHGRDDAAHERTCAVELGNPGRGKPRVVGPGVDESVSGTGRTRVPTQLRRVARGGAERRRAAQHGQVRAVRAGDADDQVAAAGQVLAEHGVRRRREAQPRLRHDDRKPTSGDRCAVPSGWVNPIEWTFEQPVRRREVQPLPRARCVHRRPAACGRGAG